MRNITDSVCLLVCEHTAHTKERAHRSHSPTETHQSGPRAPVFINQNCIDITWHKVKQRPLAE